MSRHPAWRRRSGRSPGSLSAPSHRALRCYDCEACATLTPRSLISFTASSLNSRVNLRRSMIRLGSIKTPNSVSAEPAAGQVHLLTPQHLDRFATAVREAMRNRKSGFRRAYIRRFVERVEVDDSEIRIRGSRAALAQGLAARPGEVACGVPSFGQDWWRTQSIANPSPAIFPAIREFFSESSRLSGQRNSVKASVDRVFSKRADASIAKLSRELK